MADDSWRFADEAARKLDKTVGVYGCDLVPATTIKSATGTARGEELFHRPELYRPWRVPVQQKNAAAIVGKEQEIEHLTRRNAELRTETAALQRELQRTLQRAKLAEQGENETHEREARTLKDKIAELKTELEMQRSSNDHQLRVVRSEHEGELKQLQTKVKLVQDGANDSGALFSRQLAEVKAAAAREVALVQQLSVARTSELQNELDAVKDGLRRLQERTAELLSDSQAENRRTEERCVKQLQEQEKRLEAMRSQLHGEIQSLEADRDRLRSDLHDAQEKSKTATFDLEQSEARFKDWNVRLLSDLDQLYEYYYAVVRDVQGGDQGIAIVMRSDDSGDAPAATLKGVMERVADRLQQLTILKQQHTSASQQLQKRIRSLEASAISTTDQFRRAAEDKDVQLSRLFAESSEAKARQLRLEKAQEEIKQLSRDTVGRVEHAAHRLQFFSDDLQASLSHMGPQPVAPQGTVSLVAMHVDGAAILWEADPAAMQTAMTICFDILRAKLRQYSAYEFSSDSNSMLVAFQDSASAARFCLESQEWLLKAKWPVELLDHNAAKEERSNGVSIFRGLRVAMTMHRGEASSEETNIPVGMGRGRVSYYGPVVTQLLHLASFASGGQVICSGAAFANLQSQLSEVGNPLVTDLGQHRIAVASRTGSRETFSAAETLSVLQLLPRSLTERSFAREGTVDSSVSGGGIGLSSHFSQASRTVVATEVASLRTRGSLLNRALETLAEETEAVSASVTSLNVKIRDAQVHGRIYSQADIVAHIAAIDRIVARSEVIRRDVERVGVNQKETVAAIKCLEEQVSLQAKVSLSEDEFKKKLELVNDRANEKMFELKLQADHQTQQLKNSLQKAEGTIVELRKQQSASGAGDSTSMANISKVSAVAPAPAPKKSVRTASRPRTASATKMPAPKK